MVAAVGSLIIRRTLRSAITPACKVEKQSNSTMKEANSVVATQEEEQVGLKSERRIWVWMLWTRERGRMKNNVARFSDFSFLFFYLDFEEQKYFSYYFKYNSNLVNKYIFLLIFFFGVKTLKNVKYINFKIKK
ncbi:hypothetical protein BDE02_13G037900 [Populus trichocarpa]|nr:hypothetical protein BDE02_13G037900 [Populus trichocarpa]